MNTGVTDTCTLTRPSSPSRAQRLSGPSDLGIAALAMGVGVDSEVHSVANSNARPGWRPAPGGSTLMFTNQVLAPDLGGVLWDESFQKVLGEPLDLVPLGVLMIA